MNKNMKIIAFSFVCMLIALPFVGCSKKGIPDWAIGKWSNEYMEFEISKDSISMEEFGETLEMAWGKKTSFSPIDGMNASATAKITKTSGNEFAFSIELETNAFGDSAKESVELAISKGKDNSYTLSANGESAPISKK
ncbi:MAG TPA: hypothetical protein DCO86_04275 [Spirochaetaceae bacterium]|nr:hypothetical protein [Spirochaetaceae bacterium]